MARDSYPLIAYRNDALGKGNIQKLIVSDTTNYSHFLEVIDYPLNKENLNKRMIWIPDSGKKDTKEERVIARLKNSGDWGLIGKVLVKEKNLNKK